MFRLLLLLIFTVFDLYSFIVRTYFGNKFLNRYSMLWYDVTGWYQQLLAQAPILHLEYSYSNKNIATLCLMKTVTDVELWVSSVNTAPLLLH